MRFGLFSMGEHPGRVPRDAYEEDLQEIILADGLGWDEVWIGEHHLNGKQEVLPFPEMLIAKAAARTQRIRLGPGVRLLALHYPLDVASEAATADHLTDGRYNFGYGTGSALEFGFYNVPFAEAQTRLEESLDLILRAWTHDGPFSWDGRFWQFKDVYIWPRPLQQPHMPLARAGVSAQAYYDSGRRGFTMLASTWQGDAAIGANWGAYERGARESGREARREQLHVCRICWVGESDCQARDTIRPWMNRSLDYLRALQPGVRAALEQFRPTPDADVEAVTFDHLADIGQFIVGSPDTVIRGLRRLYAEVGGFGTLLLVVGRDPAPIDERLAMFDRFAREVAPALTDLN
jgi:alkanesulfonate monooxygenase SsuD/methylene tetrahydromethanopterin reductase-like flavin-dependent oxidoreductase (luciferase family)